MRSFAIVGLFLASMGARAAWSQEAGEPAGPGADAGVVAPPVPVGPPPGASAAERDRWLAGAVAAAVAARPSLAGARIGVVALDVGTGRVLVERDADRPLNVASNAKLATTAAALALLGPDFVFRTSVFVERMGTDGVVAGDLYVRGHGDPSLGTSDLRDLARDVKLAGVTRVRGKLVIDDTYFDAETTPPHFDEQPNDPSAYRAPIGALAVDFNMITVVVRPAAAAGQMARFELDPPAPDYVEVTDELVTVAEGRNRIGMTGRETATGLEIKLAGQIRLDAGVRRLRRRVAQPHLFAASVVRALLAEQGVRIERARVERRAVPATAKLIAVRESPPLSVLVRGMGKHSNNFVAETVLKTVGAETRADPLRPATWDDGLAAVRRWLVESGGLPAGGFRYDNGSGLFDASAFSPRQLATVLRAAYRDFRIGPDLVASLSTAGADGTLRGRMVGTPAERIVRAKTGTLARVVVLSGYAGVDGTRPIAFSVGVNDLVIEGRGNTAKVDARSLVDEIAVLIALYARAA